jgi:hypothetical protein
VRGADNGNNQADYNTNNKSADGNDKGYLESVNKKVPSVLVNKGLV